MIKVRPPPPSPPPPPLTPDVGMERGLSDASLLSRRRSSRLEQLERASSAYTPSLSFIGNGGTSTAACGSINNNLTSFASMTSIPALSSVASVSGSKILSGASYRTTQEDDEIMHATEDDEPNQMMLLSDMILAWDPAFKVHLEAYANDEQRLRDDFGKAFKKLTELGCGFA